MKNMFKFNLLAIMLLSFPVFATDGLAVIDMRTAVLSTQAAADAFKALEEDFSYIIIELSSYQLEYIKNLDSFISIILNISEDHLDRHDSLKEYLDIKLQIFNNARNCIINSDI